MRRGVRAHRVYEDVFLGMRGYECPPLFHQLCIGKWLLALGGVVCRIGCLLCLFFREYRCEADMASCSGGATHGSLRRSGRSYRCFRCCGRSGAHRWHCSCRHRLLERNIGLILCRVSRGCSSGWHCGWLWRGGCLAISRIYLYLLYFPPLSVATKDGGGAV